LPQAVEVNGDVRLQLLKLGDGVALRRGEGTWALDVRFALIEIRQHRAGSMAAACKRPHDSVAQAKANDGQNNGRRSDDLSISYPQFREQVVEY
jgi:hypothetical protein